MLEQIKNLKEREPKNQGNKYDVINSNYKEELLHLKKFNQDMLIQDRKLKQENESLQENVDCKRSSVDKETMTNAIEKSSKDQIQTSEKGSNAKLFKVQNKNLIVTSLQASTEFVFHSI